MYVGASCLLTCFPIATRTVHACGCNEHGQCGVAPVDSLTKQTDKVNPAVYGRYLHEEYYRPCICTLAYTHASTHTYTRMH